MTKLTLFEHESLRASDHRLTDRHLRLVDRVNRAVGTEVLRASYRNGGTLTACQHIGVIRLGNRTIQVLPKIDYPAHGQTPEQTATRNQALHVRGLQPLVGEGVRGTVAGAEGIAI